MLYKPSELHPNFEEIPLVYNESEKFWELPDNITFELQVNTNGSKARSYKIDILKGENDPDDFENNVLGSLYGEFTNAIPNGMLTTITITKDALQEAGIITTQLEASVDWRWRIRVYEDPLSMPEDETQALNSLYGRSYIGEGYLVGSTKNVLWLSEAPNALQPKSYIQQFTYSDDLNNDFKPFKNNQGLYGEVTVGYHPEWPELGIDINDILPKYQEVLSSGHVYVEFIDCNSIPNFKQQITGPCRITSTRYEPLDQHTYLCWSEEQGTLYPYDINASKVVTYRLIYRDRQEIDVISKSIGSHQLTKVNLDEPMKYNQTNASSVECGLMNDDFAQNRLYIAPVPEFDDKSNGLAYISLTTCLNPDFNDGFQSGLGKMVSNGTNGAWYDDGHFKLNTSSTWNERLFFKKKLDTSTFDEYESILDKPDDWDVTYLQLPVADVAPPFDDVAPVYKYWGGNSYIQLDNCPTDWNTNYMSYYIQNSNSGKYNTYYYNDMFSNRNEPKASAFTMTSYTPVGGSGTPPRYDNQKYSRKIINYVGTTGECTLFDNLDFMPDVRYTYEIYLQDKSTATWDNPIYTPIVKQHDYYLGGAHYPFREQFPYLQIISNSANTRQNPQGQVDWGDNATAVLSMGGKVSHRYTANRGLDSLPYCAYDISMYDKITQPEKAVSTFTGTTSGSLAFDYPVSSTIYLPPSVQHYAQFTFKQYTSGQYITIYWPKVSEETVIDPDVIEAVQAVDPNVLIIYYQGDKQELIDAAGGVDVNPVLCNCVRSVTATENEDQLDAFTDYLSIEWDNSMNPFPTETITIGPFIYDNLQNREASYTLFIQPNNAITADQYKPINLDLYKSGKGIKANGLISNIVHIGEEYQTEIGSYPYFQYNEYDKHITLDTLDNTQWMINFQTDNLLGDQAALLFPQTPYKIYSNFVDSIPECVLYLRPTKGAIFNFNNAFIKNTTPTSYDEASQIVQCPWRDIEITSTLCDIDHIYPNVGGPSTVDYPWNTVGNKSYHYVIERYCNGEHVVEDDLIQEKQYDDMFTVIYRGLEPDGSDNHNEYHVKLYVEDNLGHEWIFPTEQPYITIMSQQQYEEDPTLSVCFDCNKHACCIRHNASTGAQSAVLYRQKLTESAWHYMGYLPFDLVDTTTNGLTLYDYNIASGESYRYSLVYNPDISGSELQVTEYTNNEFVKTVWNGWSITDCIYDIETGLYKVDPLGPVFIFDSNLEIGDISDNLKIIKYETLGRFNKMIQTVQRFDSGSLTTLFNDFACRQQLPDYISHIVDLTKMTPSSALQTFIEGHSSSNFAELVHLFFVEKSEGRIGPEDWGFLEDGQIRLNLNKMFDPKILESQGSWTFLYQIPGTSTPSYYIYDGLEVINSDYVVPKIIMVPQSYYITNDQDLLNKWKNFVADGQLKLLKSPDGVTRLTVISDATSYTTDYRSDQYPTTIHFTWQEVADGKYASILGW